MFPRRDNPAKARLGTQGTSLFCSSLSAVPMTAVMLQIGLRPQREASALLPPRPCSMSSRRCASPTARISTLVGDKFADEWVTGLLCKHGVAYKVSPRPKSNCYRDLL